MLLPLLPAFFVFRKQSDIGIWCCLCSLLLWFSVSRSTFRSACCFCKGHSYFQHVQCQLCFCLNNFRKGNSERVISIDTCTLAALVVAFLMRCLYKVHANGKWLTFARVGCLWWGKDSVKDPRKYTFCCEFGLEMNSLLNLLQWGGLFLNPCLLLGCLFFVCADIWLMTYSK